LPTHVKLRYHQSFLIAGDKHEITCETRGSRPRALTTWWLNGHKIGVGTQETIREGGNLTLSILHFTPTPEDNGKRLICKSANPALPKTTIEDGIFLKVHYIPIVNISFSSSMADSKVKEGNDVYLECSIRANPWVFEIEWHFEDRALTTNRTAGIIISNQTLLLQNVGKKHRGRYRCLATNTVGQGRSNYQYLLVQFTPVCSFTEPQFYGVTTGETVNVTCEVEADPSNVVFRWSINNSLDTTLLRNWSNDGTRSVISYSPQILRNSGFGNLLCWARNSLGIQKEPCVIKVVPADCQGCHLRPCHFFLSRLYQRHMTTTI
ncbi:peroxidasin homolog, partial [Stegodyphus dumicola]|uniref:peroxidasin homolog n=1 Tax=Stegodyphus dumicola TaxID=202533 RepID=UPI0015AC8CD0